MIDVHCHLADNKFKNDVDAVIEAAKRANVLKIVAVAEFESQFEQVVRLARQNPGFVYAGIGIHPIQKRNRGVQHKHIIEMESYISKYQQNLVCVGEIGLDHTTSQFKLTPDDLKVQEEVFIAQIRLARHFGLPVNVHSRSAADRTIQVLRSENAEGVVMHAFDGSVEEALSGASRGYHFSIPPSFGASQRARDVFEALPLEQLLLETDAPALGCERGTRNEPKNLRISAEILAQFKRLTVESAVEITSDNAKRVFSLA